MDRREWDWMLEPLDPEEKAVMQLRLGVDRGTVPRPIEEVADILKISPSQVTDIEDGSMRKLRALEGR